MIFFEYNLLKCVQIKNCFIKSLRYGKRKKVWKDGCRPPSGSRNWHWQQIPRVAIGQNKEDVKEFGVYTENLNEICIHLKKHEITSVAMESTGNYWKALFVLLQSNGFIVILDILMLYNCILILYKPIPNLYKPIPNLYRPIINLYNVILNLY